MLKNNYKLLSKFLALFKENKIVVFFFFLILVFFFYRQLFDSYFEADEWYAFTLNFPLTRDPLGFLKILVNQTTDAPSLVQLQHIVPLSIEIFFLNTFFFGTNFIPYALISLILHSINSFLVFIFIRLLLPRKLIFAFLGGLFFALSPIHMGAVRWAATYQTSVLPITFFLLSVIYFKMAFLREKKKYIYFSLISLLLGLLTKESVFILFILLPIMVVMEERIFSLRFLAKLFILVFMIYTIFRFLVPLYYSLPALKGQPKAIDTKTIVSKDLSIHKDLAGEIVFRTITFPIRMVGSSFLPRQTVFSIVQFITPVVSPLPPGGDTLVQSYFLYSTGNFFVIYLASLAIIIFCLNSIIKFVKAKQFKEAQSITIGLGIIFLSALPLVAIIFSFPRWGYDFYFESRYYYNADVGSAILFPFLIFGISKLIARNPYIRKISTVAIFVFLIWLINNMYIFDLTTKETRNLDPDRREVINQIKAYLPKLPAKAVFYFETDGKSAFGPVLPFFTSVPQALTVVYYDKSPLPDSFFNKPLFGGQSYGYQYSEGRGLGYYTSKKELVKAVAANKFSVNDIYAFYFYAEKVKLKNTTVEIRKEVKNLIKSEK